MKDPNTNFGALNNLLQNELLIRALYTNLIEEGGEESEKGHSQLKFKNGCDEQSFSPHTIQIQTKKNIRKLWSLHYAF